jgi:ribokinase
VDEVLSHFSEEDIVLLQNETNMVSDIIRKASAKRMRVAFNAAPFTDAVKSYPVSKVTWLFVNEIEGAALSGESEYNAIADKLHAMYPETDIILTLGAQGSIYNGSEGKISMPAKQVVPVDTTAAGDAFTGYYLMSNISGLGARRSLEIATAASAVTVTCHGAADSIPSIDMLKL